MGKFEDLRAETIEAFEESTGEAPNDYERGTIDVVVREFLESHEEERG